MFTSLSKTCTAVCTLALLSAAPQIVEATVPLVSPDIIEISVQHLSEVQSQLRQGLGISWGKPTTSSELVDVGGEVQLVEFTRVFSVSSYPYIELIQTSPQIAPWTPFNNANPELGDGPRTSLVWRVANSDFEDVKMQMLDAGLTIAAESRDFIYFEALEGTLLEIVRDHIAPDPKHGKPNTPPAGITDFGAMTYLSWALQPAPTSPGVYIPIDDFILRQQISAATGGGIKWDVNEPLVTPIPYNLDSNPSAPVLLGNPSIVNSCNQKPLLDVLVIYPNIAPFGASSNSTTFSHTWVVPKSGIDPTGAAVMAAAEAQLVAAGFQSVIRLDAQTLGITPYPADILRYYVGIDNVDIQLANLAFAPVPVSCTEQCGTCTP